MGAIGVSVATTLVTGVAQKLVGVDFSANNVQYIKKGDGFAYRVVVQSNKRYCGFQLKIDASVNGNSQAITVGDQNGPFRVSGLICGPSTAVEPSPKFSASPSPPDPLSGSHGKVLVPFDAIGAALQGEPEQRRGDHSETGQA
jgi:hypothetical protein